MKQIPPPTTMLSWWGFICNQVFLPSIHLTQNFLGIKGLFQIKSAAMERGNIKEKMLFLLPFKLPSSESKNATICSPIQVMPLWVSSWSQPNITASLCGRGQLILQKISDLPPQSATCFHLNCKIGRNNKMMHTFKEFKRIIFYISRIGIWENFILDFAWNGVCIAYFQWIHGETYSSRYQKTKESSGTNIFPTFEMV